MRLCNPVYKTDLQPWPSPLPCARLAPFPRPGRERHPAALSAVRAPSNESGSAASAPARLCRAGTQRRGGELHADRASAACTQGPAAARHAVLAPGAARVRGRAGHRLRRAGALPARARSDGYIASRRALNGQVASHRIVDFLGGKFNCRSPTALGNRAQTRCPGGAAGARLNDGARGGQRGGGAARDGCAPARRGMRWRLLGGRHFVQPCAVRPVGRLHSAAVPEGASAERLACAQPACAQPGRPAAQLELLQTRTPVLARAAMVRFGLSGCATAHDTCTAPGSASPAQRSAQSAARR